jgi:hypothetical protein
MFCFDERGWEGSKKKVYYLHNVTKDSFGGGYDEAMNKQEYELFKKAEDEKDIDLFIDNFVESIEKELEKFEEKEKD